MGIHTGMSDRNSHIGSLKLEFQLFIFSVRSWSNLWISCQVILQDYLIVITREKHYRCIFFLDLLMKGIPEKVLQFLDSFLCE